MPNPIKDSELILNNDGSIYHLHLLPEHISDIIITVGDPDRVAMVSNFFDRIEVKQQKREFVTHTGYLNNRRLTVISSGIGTDNIDIIMNELDALVNFDLASKMPHKNKKSLRLIRLGTSGALQASIRPDELVFSKLAIGLDNLMSFYDYETEVEYQYILNDFRRQVLANTEQVFPYIAHCSNNLLELLNKNKIHHEGITLTCPGFYGPQGRRLRLNNKFSIPQKAASFVHNGIPVTNFEMETSALYALSSALGHEALSINVILANRANGTFSANPSRATENMIGEMLEQISYLN